MCLAYVCPEGKKKCADGLQCVEEEQTSFCNGHADCNDRSDEDPGFCRGIQILNCWTFCFEKVHCTSFCCRQWDMLLILYTQNIDQMN